MMRNLRQAVAGVLALALACPAALVEAQGQRPYRANDQRVQRVLDRIETRAETFRLSLDDALDNSRLNGTATEDTVNNYVSEFERATDRLRERFNDRRAVSADVQEVLNRALYIDEFVRQNQLGNRARRDWNMLRSDLNLLAQYYNVAWNWNARPGYAGNSSGSYGGNYGGQAGFSATLTGTYRLDRSRSESAYSVADRATRDLPVSDQQRVRDNLARRLESPDVIAIDQRGRNFTLASSLAPQISFEANGREQTEYVGDNRRVSVRASMTGDQLVVSTSGYRGSDYQVTFDPENNGRTMRVTRRIWNERLAQPVVAISYYDRTSEVAQLDIYNGNQVGWNDGRGQGAGQNSGTMAGRTGRFYIPNDAQLVATLNSHLSTETAREGDRFSMTVRSPGQYAGAVIEGSLTGADRGGRVSGRSELALNFERIRLQNGQVYDFTGYIEEVRTPNGERVQVNNEGSVKNEDSQTEKTVTRAGIGAALGAIIGAVAGGGKGAAIGAAIGAGAGAGSVFIQGRGDLELQSGSEFTIRASAPQR
jgi:hypothetical protein